MLALPRWRLLLAWMVVDALVWVPRMYQYLGVDDKGLPVEPFLVTVLVPLRCGASFDIDEIEGGTDKPVPIESHDHHFP